MSIKLKAIHEIVRGEAGKRETLSPGKVFSAETAEAEHLLNIGAATKATRQVHADTEIGKVDTNTGTNTSDAGDAGDAGDAAGEGTADKPLDEMTVSELHAYAEARAIEIDGKLKLKADILAAIKHAEEDII